MGKRWEREEDRIILNNKGMDFTKLKELLPERTELAIAARARALMRPTGQTWCKNAPAIWTDDEDKILIDGAGKINMYEACILLPNRSKGAIKHRCEYLGIRLGSNKKSPEWQDWEDEVIRKNAGILSANDIAGLLPGRVGEAVRKRATEIGVVLTLQYEVCGAIFDSNTNLQVGVRVKRRNDSEIKNITMKDYAKLSTIRDAGEIRVVRDAKISLDVADKLTKISRLKPHCSEIYGQKVLTDRVRVIPIGISTIEAEVMFKGNNIYGDFTEIIKRDITNCGVIITKIKNVTLDRLKDDIIKEIVVLGRNCRVSRKASIVRGKYIVLVNRKELIEVDAQAMEYLRDGRRLPKGLKVVFCTNYNIVGICLGYLRFREITDISRDGKIYIDETVYGSD